jgi:hypothetical protein
VIYYVADGAVKGVAALGMGKGVFLRQQPVEQIQRQRLTL